MYEKRNNETSSRNHCCCGKYISITYSECVFVALLVQHAKRMCHIICHLWPVGLYHIFSTLSHNGHEFRGGKILSNIKCVILIFSTPFVRKISHYTKNRGRYYHKCTYFFM